MSTSSGPRPLLETLVNHVALPPRLPGKANSKVDQIQHALTSRLVEASRTLRDQTNGEFSRQWEGIRYILDTCRTVNAGGKLNKTSLLTQFRKLEHKQLLILHIAEQNAGLLIRRNYDPQDDAVIFEAFEASPLSEKVLAAGNALEWDFPGCAVDIPYSVFENASFQHELAAFLEQASTESIKRFGARTHKAASSAFESRDTADPSLITQMLMTLLEVRGRRIFPPQLRKRVRDDVCWTHGAEQPWRRLPYWLVLRVGIERHLCTLHGGEAGRAHYKFLICVVLAQLIDDALEHLGPELLALLNAKLTRRIVKLEVEKDRASPNARPVYDALFATLGSLLHKTITKASKGIEVAWNVFKGNIRRPIPVLHRRAHKEHLTLSLPNSGHFLQRVLSLHQTMHSAPSFSESYRAPTQLDISAAATNQFIAFARRYYVLSDLEADIRERHPAPPILTTNHKKHCTKLAGDIENYLSTVGNAYDVNPEQKSVMLLTVMELWVSMDKEATKIFGLLMDYNPGLAPEVLEVLQLSRFTDMCRLQKIEEYLRDRHTKCNFSQRTIFDDPSKGCFSERQFQESQDSEKLLELLEVIEAHAEAARGRKEEEWLRLSEVFEELERSITRKACVYTTDDFRVIHDDRNCEKCYLQRQAKRMRIQIHEDPLPSDPVQAKAVVFELGCSKAFKAYRNATWLVVGTLARTHPMERSEPRLKLCDYPGLQAFVNFTSVGISLASTTKSFLSTHYKDVGFPVSLDHVCLPNGLKWGYFDAETKSWPGRHVQKPTLAHHCEMAIPESSPFSILRCSDNFAADTNGPSSYEVIASQTRCPSGLNLQGFTTYQTLFSGKNRRWPQMLVELGSSNLNFSSEAVASLMTQLALQAGPAFRSDPLRIIHRIFRDDLFCKRLMEQIDQRLEDISSNWREVNCVQMLLALTLKLCFVASEPVVRDALKLLGKIRVTTFSWISRLHAEIHRSKDASTSRRCSKYAFWAALLCRKTFAVHVKGDDDGYAQTLLPAALPCFIECSITLQDNLVGDPAALPAVPRNALIDSLKMVHQMRFMLRRSIMASTDCLESAINNIWPQPIGESPRSYSSFKFLEPPDEWWMQSTIDATGQNNQQTIHYHLLEGHLLIDYQPLGKLPAEIRESVVVEQLFGTQSLLTYPSGLPGMTYMLASAMDGHQIHLGFRNKTLIVQACVWGTLLEFIPPEVFGDGSNFDLPISLVENCVHWLDLRTWVLEARQRPDIWKSKPSNWRINFDTRKGLRRTSSLVDPHSQLFQQVARIFDHFEDRGRLTVFQPERGSLSVELRRLELSFSVNAEGLLYCKQLRSVIDRNQDAGTWYGLNSKLVLHDAGNSQQRSIIVPMGIIKYIRNGFHVAVKAENTGSYGRFFINDVLGRLDCPTEPRLLYCKAQFHAYTSFVVPDPLTGCTGTEEALHCLKSGYCQPWTPLKPGLLDILASMAKLTPSREYYPRDMKKMQNVVWDPHLTTTIQHDGFRAIVTAICEKSEKLSAFALEKIQSPSLQTTYDSAHLLHRSFFRLRLYQRPHPGFDGQQTAADLPYNSRDRCQASQARLNVFESASLICNRPSEMPEIPELSGILLNWPTIGGYDRMFDKFLLSDLLDVQFAAEWGSLVNLCRLSGLEDMYRLVFLFAVMSFRDDAEMDVVRTLIAFTVLEGLKALDPPKWTSYSNFRPNHTPSAEYLVKLIKHCCVPYSGDERDIFGHSLGSKLRKKLEAAELAHEQQTESDCRALAQHFLDQWPCPEPNINEFSQSVLIDVSQAFEIIRSEYLRLYQNMELSHHVDQVQQVLDRHCTGSKFELPRIGGVDQEAILTKRLGGELATLSQYLQNKNDHNAFGALRKANSAPGSYSTNRFNKPIEGKKIVSSMSYEIQQLANIISGIADSQSTVQQQYGRDLMESLEAFKALKNTPQQREELNSLDDFQLEISTARQSVQDNFHQLCMTFERNDPCAQWLKEGGLWPCITPVTLLEQLRSTSAITFGDGMKESLVAYAVSIAVLQRILRIQDAHSKGDNQRLHEELKNSGHKNWQPLENPDWLLLEIDANILVRHDQVDVAAATISPASGSNSVLQMNMGQGKTSCIMPMVAAALADRKKLVRVVVPKSLLLQTAQTLQARLGGLLGREVRYVPFSRKTPTNEKTIKAYFNIHKEVRASSGVIVALPENILSFMLSGLQRLSDARIPEATQMVKVQAWMRQVSRDILDECDFTLAVQTQLIYPSGSQTTVDGHPHRWWTAEALLALVEGHLWNLQRDFPQSIDVVRRPQGGFPYVFFLRKDAEDALIERLVNDIVRGHTSIVPAQECRPSDRNAIKGFISDPNVRPAIAERIRQMFPDKPALKQKLYLLRGLLVHRILLLSLKKRWNVQYGLHPNRDPIAVPFHAKGVPSEQAEWGHPDVAILFTCLAFYYGGLDLAQLRQSLEHVLKSDDPLSEYDRWTHSSKELPDSLREWTMINVDDKAQLMEIWQFLRFEVVVINYFLNHFVFPKHAKQFQVKLQASGWDIPLFSPESQSLSGKQGVEKYSQPLTTGFSGTNDNRRMLPLTIKQKDLPGLSHTNAEVLTYLLKPQNRRYVLAADYRGKHLAELDLLQMLKQMKIRMLIDAGAQILEMDNLSLAKAWLKIDHEAPAAVYFDAGNKPFVLYRHGSQTPLLASPFADNLGDCLVYLDEAHTRGTDLKMPANATGALTLGLGQTKDQTVQAAMRLRQLATSQSVIFFAPPEVHQSILDLRQKRPFDSITSYDVICWLLQQTCSRIEQIQPLYFSQGTDFCRRQQAALDNPDCLVDPNQRDGYLSALRQTELQTLAQLYKPRLKSATAKVSKFSSSQLASFMEELNRRRKGFQDTGNAVHGSALQEVEQEREVAFEVEAVREVQKPVHYSPLVFSGLHRDVAGFVKTGRLAAGYGGYEPAYAALGRTALGLKHGISSEATASKLFVSREFSRTVSLPLGRPNDNFLRQVSWILWSVVTEVALVIIPEEAEICLPILCDADESPTHLLTYAAPVTRKMLHFNNLTYYAVPALPEEWMAPTWLTTELGIFAGRLYFDFDEYSHLRKFLGLRDNSPKPTETTGEVHEHDREAPETASEQEMETSVQQEAQSFTPKPLTFLQEWLALRRKGQDFTHTPMGYVCQGKPLTRSHPFFTAPEKNAAPRTNRAAEVRSALRGGENNGGWSADADMASDPEDFGDDGYLDEDGVVEGEGDGTFSESGQSGEDVSVGVDGTDYDAIEASQGLSPLSQINGSFE